MFKYITNKKYREDYLGWWNLEEASGTRGGSHNLTDNGGTTQVKGIDGFAASFTSTQWLESAAAIITSGDYSVGLWYNPLSVAGSFGIIGQMLKPNPGTGINGTFTLYQQSANINFGISNPTSLNLRGTTVGTVKADAWNSIVVTLQSLESGLHKRQLWLNGFLQDNVSIGSGVGYGGLFRIGWSSTVVGEATGNGAIDRVRVWNRVISDREAMNFSRNPYRW